MHAARVTRYQTTVKGDIWPCQHRSGPVVARPAALDRRPALVPRPSPSRGQQVPAGPLAPTHGSRGARRVAAGKAANA